MLNGPELYLTDYLLMGGAGSVVVGLLGCAWNVGSPLQANSRRGNTNPSKGPWCVVLDHFGVGYEVLEKTRTKTRALNWRDRHRNEYEGTLFVMPMGLVRQKNADMLQTPQYWEWFSEMVALAEEAELLRSTRASEAVTSKMDLPVVSREPIPVIPMNIKPANVVNPTQRLSLSR